MAYEVTSLGFYKSMHNEISPGMIRIINAVECDESFVPFPSEIIILEQAINKGYIKEV